MPWPGSMAAIEQYTVPEAPPSPRSVMPRKTNMPRSAAASRMSWSSGPSASTAASTYSAYACFWAGSLNAAPFVRQTQNGYPARNVSGNTATPAPRLPHSSRSFITLAVVAFLSSQTGLDWTTATFIGTSVSHARAGRDALCSVHLEIFLVLPVGHMLEEPADLEVFDAQQVVDEDVAESLAEELVLAQLGYRVHQAARQRRCRRRIRLQRRGGRFEPSPQPVEAARDLGCDVQVRVGCRVADPVLNVRGRRSWLANHPQHRPPALDPPGDAVGSERVRPVPLVAGERGGGEQRRRDGVLQQSGQPHHACLGEVLLPVEIRERIPCRPGLAQRLVQVPPAREELGERGTCHEGGVVAKAPADLLDGRPQQQRAVGRRHRLLRLERELDLAWSPFVLDGSQRQAKLGQLLRKSLQELMRLVRAAFGQVLKAVREAPPLRRRWRPAAVLRLQHGVEEPHDVELDLESHDEFESLRGQLIELPAQEAARREP